MVYIYFSDATSTQCFSEILLLGCLLRSEMHILAMENQDK